MSDPSHLEFEKQSKYSRHNKFVKHKYNSSHNEIEIQCTNPKTQNKNTNHEKFEKQT